jgi:hypothetical protein
MERILLLSFLSLLSFWKSSMAEPLKVEITSPSSQSSVPQRPIVEGLVSDPAANVWVVVHPLEVSDYWVQPLATVGTKGSWKAQIHIGRPGDLDVGKTFEIRAVANPKKNLQEGMILPGWPEAGAISDVVEVTRRN